MDSFLGDDPLDPPLSSELLHGAGLDEIRTFFPSDAPAAEVDFDVDEFDDLEWPQLHEFDDDMVLPRPRDEIEESPPPPYTERPSQPPAYATAALPRVEEITEASPQAEEITEVSPQAEEAAEHQFPVPPPSALYDSFDELLAFLQTFHRDNGAALRTERSSNPQTINGERVLTYRALVCDRAGSQASRSTGIRRSSTQQTGCLYKITATAKKSAN